MSTDSSGSAPASGPGGVAGHAAAVGPAGALSGERGEDASADGGAAPGAASTGPRPRRSPSNGDREGASPPPQAAQTRAAAANLPPAATTTPTAANGFFAGEWSFRGVFEAAGWRRHVPGRPLPPCSWLVVAENASPGESPPLDPLAHFESEDRFPLRVVDLRHHVGLHAETLGPLPFGLARGPLESATLYRSPGCPTTE